MSEKHTQGKLAIGCGTDIVTFQNGRIMDVASVYCHVINGRAEANAPSNADRQRAKEVEAAESLRSAWIQALQHDRLRAWMNIGESDAGLLNALVSLLTIAGLAHVHATGKVDLPDLNIIRGGISAATQCVQSGCIVTVELARSWDVAIERCIEILQKMPVDSVIHAAVSIRRELGIDC